MKKFVALLIAVLLVACGGQTVPTPEVAPTAEEPTEAAEPTEEPMDDPTDAPEPTEEPTEEGAEEAGGPTIADLAAESEELGTLAEALAAADLTETLGDAETDFTVFAPSDDAFGALETGTLETLLTNPTQLGELLTYHVVEGTFTAADLSDGQTLTTVQGDTITVSIADDTVTLNPDGNAATVTTADIEAANGVIHVIDTVLFPPEFEVSEGGGQTLSDLLNDEENLNTLVGVLESTGLLEQLAEQEVTLFAPQDSAFAEVDPTVLTDLEQVGNILQYHVVEGTYTSDDLASTDTLTTLEGGELTFSISLEEGLTINQTAQVVHADLQAGNSIIHIIDTVLTPPTE